MRKQELLLLIHDGRLIDGTGHRTTWINRLILSVLTSTPVQHNNRDTYMHTTGAPYTLAKFAIYTVSFTLTTSPWIE